MRKLGDSADTFLSNILNNVSNNLSLQLNKAKEIYSLPVRVGIKNQSIDDGDRPWIVGRFYPGKYLNDTHPQGHEGVDLKAPAGTAIYPIGPGIVLNTMNSGKGGISCRIAHEGGNVISYYAHMKELRVKAQDQVLSNTIIGTVGDTGNAKGRGAHLHYEVKVDGNKIDPLSINGKTVGSLSKINRNSNEIYYDLIKSAGLLKYPQEIFDEIWKFAEKTFANIVYKLLYEETDKKYNSVLKYIHKNYEIFNFNVLDTELNHSIEFQNDQGLNDLNIYFKYGNIYLSGDYDNFGFQENKFIHEINFYLGDKEIYEIKSIELFVEDVGHLKRTVMHECRHLQQEIYGAFLDPNPTEKAEILGGLPPKRLRNKNHSPWGHHYLEPENEKKDKQYELRDVEFYPILQTQIEYFLEEKKNLKPNKNDNEEERIKKENLLKSAFKAFVGSPVETEETNKYFSILKNKKFKKWKKAVSEFYKAVFGELQKMAGLPKTNEKLVKEICDWIVPQYALYIINVFGLHIFDKSKLSIKENLIEFLNYKRILRSYITTGTQEKRKKFIDPVSGNKIIVEILRQYMDKTPEFAGEFNSDLNKIKIVFYYSDSISTFLKNLERIKDTVEHEVDHFIQKISDNKRNMPSRKIRSKNFDTEGVPTNHDKKNMPDLILNYDQHQENVENDDMWDSEFYPRLKDSIKEFLLNHGKDPIDKKRIEAKKWINHHWDYPLDADPFFTSLKVYNFDKWKKAVKEFYKAVFNE